MREQAEPLRWATSYHAPVMAADVVTGLVTDRAGLYIDGTLGGGGHSAALLASLGTDALVVGIDQDDEALAAAGARLADDIETGRFVALKGNFADVDRLLRQAALGPTYDRPVAGILLDLGVSSHQIDAAERGFAFSADGPLDMRMDSSSAETAADLIGRVSESDLANLIYAFGEEGRSRRIAKAIKTALRMETTGDLAAAVRSAVPTREEVKVLARVFQALRIAVNREMDVLERALEASRDLLAPGGRLAVIAYHSLEDRRAKQFLRAGKFTSEIERDGFGNPLTPFSLITRKAIVATDTEIAANGRARSARLRIAERVALPNEVPPPGPSERHPGP